MDEWRAEHPRHLLVVDDCPYCRVRTLTSGEVATAKVGSYCMLHGVTDCPAPDCWHCGNHQMTEDQRCSDPGCRALNNERACEIAALYPGQVEVISYLIAQAVLPSSSQAGRAATGRRAALPDKP